MLIVRPIQTKSEQAEACLACHIEYKADCLAYGAYLDDEFVGISQFSLNDERGIIEDLAPVSGKEDFESLFIMGRQTMNFIDLCGVHIAEMRKDAASERMIVALGFKRTEEGGYRLDMTGFFEGGACTSHKD